MRRVTTRLSRRLKQATARSGMNMREVAVAADVPYGWVRQIVAGGIARPDAARLTRLAGALGIPPSELLALSDQLGAEAPDFAGLPVESDVARAIRDQTEAIKAQTAMLALLIERLPAPLQFADDEIETLRAMARTVPRHPASRQGTPTG